MTQIVLNTGASRSVGQIASYKPAPYKPEGLSRLLEVVLNWSDRYRNRRRLYEMPDYMLRDIGVSRSDVEAEWNKPFWRE